MATTHKYSFLICLGDGIIGNDTTKGHRASYSPYDHFYTVDVEAKTLRDAIPHIYPELTNDTRKGGFDSWFTEWSGLDEDATDDEILDALENNVDYACGCPWLVSYTVDGVLIHYSEYGIEDLIEEYRNMGRGDIVDDFIDYLKNLSGIDLMKWGIELPETDEEDYDEDEEDEENYDFEGYTPTPEAVKKCFHGNPDYFDEAAEIVAGWYEYEDSTFGNCEFRSEEDFYAREDIGELIDAADDEEERAIVTVAYDSFYKDKTPEDLLEDDEE